MTPTSGFLLSQGPTSNIESDLHVLGVIEEEEEDDRSLPVISDNSCPLPPSMEDAEHRLACNTYLTRLRAVLDMLEAQILIPASVVSQPIQQHTQSEAEEGLRRQLEALAIAVPIAPVTVTPIVASNPTSTVASIPTIPTVRTISVLPNVSDKDHVPISTDAVPTNATMYFDSDMPSSSSSAVSTRSDPPRTIRCPQCALLF